MRYKKECMVCGRQFTVSSISANNPKHPPKGEPLIPRVPYVPCIGSGQPGMVVEPVI